MEQFGYLLKGLGGIYPGAAIVKSIFFAILSVFSVHKLLFVIIGFFKTRKFKKAAVYHKYAILIPARNEEKVIGNLLKSIERQEYPKELLTVFVAADNCDDDTAKIARSMGAVCYERFNERERTKGFALQFLLAKIRKDYGPAAFEGFFIFDADNLLKKDYILRMNESFDEGEKIITSYRNTKNFDENWIASTYALHWLRSIRTRHRARSVLRLATNIQGTGFLFASELVEDGWNYTSLTEDRAFTADAVAKGYMISYNDAAVFYDEQPTSLRIAFRQRIRWSKGHLDAFRETGWKLFRNIFTGIGKECSLTDNIRYRFASFDTLSQLIPYPLMRIFMWLLVSLGLYSCSVYLHGIALESVFLNGGTVARFLGTIFGARKIYMHPGEQAMICGAVLVIFRRVCTVLWSDMKNTVMAVYVFAAERKRIKRIAFGKKLLYCFTWPTFDIFYRYSMYLALFMKVTWKTIPHTSKVTIDQIEEGAE